MLAAIFQNPQRVRNAQHVERANLLYWAQGLVTKTRSPIPQRLRFLNSPQTLPPHYRSLLIPRARMAPERQQLGNET
jgi:hypothetical protein